MPCANNWGENEVDVLIGLWGEQEIMSIFEGKQKNAKAYQKLSDMLARKGHHRSVEQVQAKIKWLRQTYMRAKDAIQKSGASPEVAYEICPYFDAMDAFMGTNPITKPHHMASSHRPSSSASTSSGKHYLS